MLLYLFTFTAFDGVATSTIDGQLSVISIDGENAVYSPELNVVGSAVREEFINRIQALVCLLL